ncbi:hypothetical protein GCM10010129_00250 [Streptomyces fumigatiscleroticus]|nr:hypothetical protein GCM10010129_00250 [Streptomyces fumigatiscleroticus]
MTTRTTGEAGTGLSDPWVARVLAEVAAAAENDDVVRRAHVTVVERDAAPAPLRTAEVRPEAALPVHPDVGRLLCQWVGAMRPRLAVEFGTSCGASTICLAAALRDNGAGQVVGSEPAAESPREPRSSSECLAAAG